MGKKKRELLPWCWYCEREFESDKVLTDHQKARHFKCLVCNKKLHDVLRLATHMDTVHKEKLLKVPNANPDREHSVDLEIYGMTGVPEADLLAHEEKVLGTTASKKLNTGNVSPVNIMPMHMYPPQMQHFYPPAQQMAYAGIYGMPTIPMSQQVPAGLGMMPQHALYPGYLPAQPLPVQPVPVVPAVPKNDGPVVSSTSTVVSPVESNGIPAVVNKERTL